MLIHTAPLTLTTESILHANENDLCVSLFLSKLVQAAVERWVVYYNDRLQTAMPRFHIVARCGHVVSDPLCHVPERGREHSRPLNIYICSRVPKERTVDVRQVKIVDEWMTYVRHCSANVL